MPRVDALVLALGPEDLNDHGELRHDPSLQTAASRMETLASPSTLCRLEQRADRETAVALHQALFDPFVGQWHSFSEFFHSVKDSVLGLGYPLIFYSVSGLPVPVLPFFAATFRPVFGIAAHRTCPDGAVADTGRSRRQYGPRFPGGRMPAEVAGSRCWPPPPQVRA